MIACPGAIAAARGDWDTLRIMQGASFERGIDASPSSRTGEIRDHGGGPVTTHHRCSTPESAIYPSQNSAMTATMMAKAAAARRGSETGRRSSARSGASVATPANSSGVGRT